MRLELIDLTLTKRVVESFVDIGGGEAEACGGFAVDADVGDAAAQLQVIGQVAKSREGAQFFGQALGPGVERRPIVAFEHVLVLAAAWPGAQVDVLPGAQVQHDARHLGQLRADTVDKFAGRHIALAAVFEGNPEAPVGDGLVAAGHAHRMRKRLHRRVGANNLGQRQMFLGHVRERDIRSGFAGAQHKTGVLHREEALGDQHIAGNGHRQRHAEHAQHQPLVGQCAFQAGVI